MSHIARPPQQHHRARLKPAGRPCFWLLVTATLIALFSAAAHAETATWSGSAGDGNWNTGGAAGNWTNLAAPGTSGTANGDADVAIFASGGATVTDSIANRELGQIIFNNTGSLGNFTIGSGTNTLYFDDLAGSSPNISEAGTSTAGISETILSNIMMTGASNPGGNDLRVTTANGFSGTITLAGNISTVATSGTSAIRIVPSTIANGSAQSTNLIVFSGVISDGAAAKVTVSRTRDGVVDFTGANTYSSYYEQGASGSTDGLNTVTEIGVNSVGSVGAITSGAFGTGTLLLNGGVISSDSTTARTIYNNISLSQLTTTTPSEAYAIGFGSTTNTGALTFAGNVNLNGDNSTGTPTATITALSTVTLSGTLFGTSSLIKAGSGTLVLSNTGNSYSGGTTVNAGTLSLTGGLTGGAAITVSGGTFSEAGSGVISAGSLSVSSGVATLAGANTYTGATSLTGGTLNVNSSGALGGGTLTIGGGTIDNTSGSAVTGQTNNPAITIGASFAYSTSAGTAANNLNLGAGAVTDGTSRTITLNGAGALTFGGVLTNTLAGANTLTVNNGTGTASTTSVSFGGYALSNSATSYTDVIAGSGNVNITGAVTNGGTATASGLTYAGSGTLTLSGTNTYSGLTTVSSGILEATGTQALPGIATTGEIVVSNGATLAVQATGAGGWTSANINTLLGAGVVTFNTGSALGIDTAGGTFTYNSNITSGNEGLTKLGAGTLILGGSNSYSAATTVSAGTLQFDGFSAMSANSALTPGSAGIIALRAETSGTFTPASIALPSSAGTTLNIDVNDLTSATGNTLTLSGALNFASTTANTINVTGGNGYTLALGNISVPSTAGSSASNTLAINANSANLTTGTLLLGSYGEGVTFGGSNTITVDHINQNSNASDALTIGSGSNSPTVTISNASTSTNSRSTGSLGITVNNGGTLNLNASSDLANGGSPLAPTLALNAGGALNLNATGDLTGVQLTVNGGTINDLSGAANTGAGESGNQFDSGFAWGGGSSVTLNGTTSLGGASTQIVITTSGTGILTLNGAIAGSGSTTQLAEAGTGILALNNANTFSGGMTLTGGQLNINNASALGSGTFTITSGTIGNSSGGSITTNNAEAWNGSFGVTSGGALSSGTGAITLGASPTVTVTSNTFTVNGSISGAGESLTEAGTGTLALGGSNSFSGGMTLSSGQLNINNNNALGTGSFVITSGSIDNTSGSSVTSTNSVQVNGNFAWKGSSALTLSGSASLSGAIPTITTAGASALSLTGIVSGASQLNVAGTGTLVLNNSNTFSGGVTIGGGTLQVGNNTTENVAALGSGTAALNSGGTLLFAPGSTSNTYDIANSFVLNGGTLNSGDGNQHIATGAGATIAVAGAGSTVGSEFNGKTLYLDGQITGNGSLTIENLDTGTSYGFSTVHITNNTNTYSGVLTVNGTANAGVELSVDVADALQDATLNLAGTGTSGATLIYTYTNSTNLLLGGLEGNGAFALKDVGGSALAVSVGNNGGSTTYSGTMSGIGSLTKVGSGTFTLSGSNSYSGGTTVSAGALIVSGSISGTASVANNATLGGGGVIGGAVTVNTGGTLAPGVAETSIAGAKLTLGAGLTLSGTSTLALNLDASNNIDSLSITGALSIGSKDTLTIDLLTGAALTQASYTIATYTGSLTGTFAITNLPSNYAVDYGVGGDSIELVAVPEPGALGTVLVGLGMLVGIQRWRKPRVGT